ncbi:MAG: electron transfer flavoprotein subunit alpha/FixB family protein [Pseudomonadota bacterium]
MMSEEIWSFIQMEGGRLHSTALGMASEAWRHRKCFNATPCGVAFGPAASIDFLSELGRHGLAKVYFVETGEDRSPELLAENLSAILLEKKPRLVLFPATPTGAEIGARVAARMRKGFISNCIDIESDKGGLVARKPVYGGKAHGYVHWLTEPPHLASIHCASLEAVEQDPKATAIVLRESFRVTQCKTTLVKRWQVPLAEMDITEARVVIGVGNGVDTPAAMGEIGKLASLVEGVVGGTRAAVFQGLIPVENQIGSTGKRIDADIYVPIGISGANRHTSGIKNVKHVVPINTHGEAPIFKFAQMGVIADLNEVVPALTEILEKGLKGNRNSI